MSTRGTRHTTLRLSPAMLQQINDEVARLNGRLRRPKWNLTEFIRMAVQERLDKLARGRKNSPRRRADAGDGAGQLEQLGDDLGDDPVAGDGAGQDPNDGTES